REECVLLCAPCDRSGRSARPEVAPGLTPDPIQQKYAQTVASTRVAPGCVQFLGEEKRFHTAWVKNGSRHLAVGCLLSPQELTFIRWACQVRKVYANRRHVRLKPKETAN